ncbi:response regulator [Hymenobacter lutimineralis]|uniref:Response regulator n=1 Tax=Hymenobacter lutimineralis TaxID=2606448 RepID=A0A5D6USA9_9BACT|nr:MULTISPECIES: response regulator [Hymenobacter]QIX59685.1 response regulator [Hymenobacter sp. BT18]TYZ06363.1 response regulator [Hymenobacter lutimineralis]
MTPLPSVLLIDDDPINNFLNKSLLTRLGVASHLQIAQSAHEALQYLAKGGQAAPEAAPSLVLLDVNMPGMSGIQFLEAYRQLPEVPPSVVVILTTSLHPRDVRQVEELGIVQDFLSKPLTPEKVNGLLRKHFNRQLPEC